MDIAADLHDALLQLTGIRCALPFRPLDAGERRELGGHLLPQGPGIVLAVGHALARRPDLFPREPAGEALLGAQRLAYRWLAIRDGLMEMARLAADSYLRAQGEATRAALKVLRDAKDGPRPQGADEARLGERNLQLVPAYLLVSVYYEGLEKKKAQAQRRRKARLAALAAAAVAAAPAPAAGASTAVAPAPAAAASTAVALALAALSARRATRSAPARSRAAKAERDLRRARIHDQFDAILATQRAAVSQTGRLDPPAAPSLDLPSPSSPAGPAPAAAAPVPEALLQALAPEALLQALSPAQREAFRRLLC